MSRSTFSAMSVISSSVKPSWPSSGPGRRLPPLELQPGQRRRLDEPARASGGSARSGAGRGCARPAGSTPARRRRRPAPPRAVSDRLPTWNRCDAMPSARLVLARRRWPAFVALDHLLGDPVLRAGSPPDRAGRSGRRPRPGSTSPPRRSRPCRTSRHRGRAPPGGGGSTPRARRGRRSPGTGAVPGSGPDASRAARRRRRLRVEPALVRQVEDPPPLERR